MDKELEKKLALVSAKYGEELPAQLKKIRDLWEALLENWSDETFIEFRQQIHTLSGSAGMFGFDHEGDIAKKIQAIYHSGLDKRPLSPLTAKDKDNINELIKLLK